MNPLKRLVGYARPYRGRFAVALTAMALYAAASAFVVQLIIPLIDEVLSNPGKLARWSVAVVIVYALKGIGAVPRPSS